MSQYKHFSIEEREKLAIFVAEGYNQTEIAKKLGRNKSSVSRELKRNTLGMEKKEKRKKEYLPIRAQARYQKRRKNCGRKRKLADPALYEKVKTLFLEEQWSPEEIAGRMELEGSWRISATTIYRAIYAGLFNEPGYSRGRKGAKRYLRHKGKPRRKKGGEDGRGKISISHPLSERPEEANNRERIGDWEEDTVLGKAGGPCLVTSVDRKSRFLVGGKSANKTARNIASVIILAHQGLPVHTITPDRGVEFSHHRDVTAALKTEKFEAEFYFPLPNHPWDRGTNENTNGLLREYFPKSTDFSKISEEEIQAVFQKLNNRPRKCLGFRTPFEVFFNLPYLLHLT